MKNYYVYPDELYHYGVKGMKWGVRRYQNEDGTYTEAGKKRRGLSDNAKKALIIGGSVVAAGLATYGVYKTAYILRNKEYTKAIKLADDYIDANYMHGVGIYRFTDGSVQVHGNNGRKMNEPGFKEIKGKIYNKRKQAGKEIGKYNAQVKNQAYKMAEESLNNKYVKTLDKIVTTGQDISYNTPYKKYQRYKALEPLRDEYLKKNMSRALGNKKFNIDYLY